MSDTTFADPQAVTCGRVAPPADAPRLLPLPDLLGALLDEAEADHAAKAAGALRGPITGLPTLDRELAGRLVPGFHVLHGNTAAGKTSFALQVAASCGFPALFVTCEMGPLELLRRVIARATGVYLGRLKSGEYSRDAFAEYANAALAACPQLALLDATRAYVPRDLIRDVAQEWRGDADHVLIVLDSLHSWATAAPSFRDWGEYEALGAAVADLQRLAAELKAPILVVNERNRASADGGGVNAAAGSRKIEYGAETVWGLYRATEADPEDPTGRKRRPKPFDNTGEVGAHLAIEKNRHGAGGRVALRFHGAQQQWREA
jgi:replicative DNA helicase